MNQTDTMLESVLPDEIPMDLNEVEISRPRDSYRETGKDKIFQGVIAKAFAGVSLNKKEPERSSNNLQLELTIRALNASGVVAGPESRFWVTLPVANPKVAGHKPYASGKEYDELHQKGREFIRAVMGADALPAFPEEKAGQKGVYVDPATGQELDIQSRKALVEGIHARTRAILTGWYNELRKAGSCELVKATLFFGVKRKKGKAFTSIQYVRYDDGGREVITDSFTE